MKALDDDTVIRQAKVVVDTITAVRANSSERAADNYLGGLLVGLSLYIAKTGGGDRAAYEFIQVYADKLATGIIEKEHPECR